MQSTGTCTLQVNILDLRSEEHTSELQSRLHLVCRLLLEKKKKKKSHVRWEWRSRSPARSGSPRAAAPCPGALRHMLVTLHYVHTDAHVHEGVRTIMRHG